MEKEIGKITHLFEKIDVAILELIDTLKVGDTIHILGSTTDFEQVVDSIQVEHKNIDSAKKGEIVGIKLSDKAKVGDKIFLK
ncbi:MAG: translation elongation factor-like protein [Candidatus Paceibacterota bacterium]|jgi:putative protease